MLPHLTIHNTQWSAMHLTLEYVYIKSSVRLYWNTFTPNIERRESNFYWKFPLRILIFSCWLEESINSWIRKSNRNEKWKLLTKQENTFHLLCGLLLTCRLQYQTFLHPTYISPVYFPLSHYFLIPPFSPLPLGTLIIPILIN